MTPEEFYITIGESYTDVMERLKREDMIIRFIKMFAEENLLAKLKDAMASGNVKAAFVAAHSLKGNCMSLGFVRLQKIAEKMTELLRNDLPEEAAPLLKPLEREYERIIEIIRKLDN